MKEEASSTREVEQVPGTNPLARPLEAVSPPFVITVAFQLEPEAADAFLALVKDNAASSVALEPECLRFDVLVPTDASGEILLYEVYRSEAGFNAHLRMPHYQSFDRQVRSLVRQKTVVRHTLFEFAKRSSLAADEA